MFGLVGKLYSIAIDRRINRNPTPYRCGAMGFLPDLLDFFKLKLKIRSIERRDVAT